MATKNDIVSLFPYQIKDVNNFYHRDHPKNLNPESTKFKQYWMDFLKKSIEGNWINDNGAWVYMMPKLFFYTNYVRIVDKKRRSMLPNLRDNEWIIFSYYLCVDGFSGFEGDEEYTCHYLIDLLEREPGSVDEIDKDNLPKSVFKKDGKYKKYIDPWYYLTRHYLIDKPCKEPLGLALHENIIYNACILSGRGVGKSFCTFTGAFIHEYLFSGVKRMSDIGHVNDRLLFGMGSGAGKQLDRSINNIKSAYTSMPGQYVFKDKNKPKYMGPFYKKVQGVWKAGGEIEHIIKYGKGSIDTQGSSLQMVALTADQVNVGAGDRFRYQLVEEWGFQGNAIEVHAANKDSLSSMGEKVGIAFYIGTSGDMDAIKEPKAMFENPGAYDIYGIPNYWKNTNKKIGLFIPATYALDKFKDINGNTKVELAYNFIVTKRAKDKQVKDSVSYDKDVMFNPLNPDEMLRSSNNSFLPKQEAQEQINRIEAYDLFKKKAQIGTLSFDPLEKTGVRWDKDIENKLRPILDLKIDDETTNDNKRGAIIIYEQPHERLPPFLYYVLYDPARKSGTGRSMHSALVYKHFYMGNESTLEDTIVAEWIGRMEMLSDNFMEVIKLAKYFNATIFPEVNDVGFMEFCMKVPAYYNMIEGDAWKIEQAIHQGKTITRNFYKRGTHIDDRKKQWCLQKLSDWLLTSRDPDRDGIPQGRTINKIYSLRILNEIIAFVDKKGENFDHISSLILLMMLIAKIEDRDPVDLSEEEELEDKFAIIDYDKYSEVEAPRSKFLNY